MDLLDAWQDLALDDRDRHAEALVAGATRLLRAGQARRAFELADRRCRLPERPGPADRAIRALAGRLCGWPLWREELDRAVRADPLDPVANSALLRLGEPAERRAAALRLVESPEAQAAQIEDALAELFRLGERACLRLDLVDLRVSGWAAWTPGGDGDGEPVLEVEGPDAWDALPLGPAGAGRLPFLPPGAAGARVEARLAAEGARACRLRLGETVLARGLLHPRGRRGDPASDLAKGPPDAVPARAPLVVVVPVHADFEATQDCLRAAVAETAGRPGRRLVVVDDASPDPKLKLLLDALAGRGMIELIRSELNLGFAGAVRRGLADAGRADVLLLNADARLPPGALDRLADAAYAEPDIGTVTPLSNNGEYASFPGAGGPAPTPAEAARIDAAAARVNAGRRVDLPTGTGFCLFLRHDCRAAVGGLPAIYGRGYFEDMELCLRARAQGFRSVCAPSVFVVHHGSRSFGLEKGVLVARNLRILRARFPGIEAECAAFVAADPLAAARRAIEAELGAAPAARSEPEPELATIEPLAYPPDAPLSLGLLSSVPSAAADALAEALSAALRRRRPDARLVVLGRCLDDLALMGRGNVLVAGPADGGPDEGFRLALLGVRALVRPPGSPASDGFERFCRRYRLPGVAARSGASPDPDLLFLDPQAHDSGHALAIVDWFAGRCPA